MKFWKFSTTAVAALLASVSMVSAGGPADGQAAADPDSAVVKLTEKEFKGFLEENPLVLTEFLLHGVDTARSWVPNSRRPLTS